MNRPIVLDAGPLGRIAHPRPNKEIVSWLQGMLSAGATIIVPEIADYEVRRNLLLEGLTKSIERLDQLKDTLMYLPLNTLMMLKAAELWAEVRRARQPTADPKALDGDVILAAQALNVGGIIATENVGHLSRFTEARHWKDITIDLFRPALTFPKSAFDVEYPVQDFLDDIDKTLEPRKSKVIDYPFSLNIPGESSKKKMLIDELKTIGYFTNKYGDQLGPARAWRCKVSLEFLSKTEDVLIQHGIVIRQADHSTINDEFLSYLLNIQGESILTI